jgi:hypothetical protein
MLLYSLVHLPNLSSGLTATLHQPLARQVAVYTQVVADFAQVNPYVQVATAFTTAILAQFERASMDDIPTNRWYEDIRRPPPTLTIVVDGPPSPSSGAFPSSSPALPVPTSATSPIRKVAPVSSRLSPTRTTPATYPVLSVMTIRSSLKRLGRSFTSAASKTETFPSEFYYAVSWIKNLTLAAFDSIRARVPKVRVRCNVSDQELKRMAWSGAFLLASVSRLHYLLLLP